MDEETAGTTPDHPGADPLNALTLRRIAEWASGVRGKNLWFVVDPDPPKKFEQWKGKIHAFGKKPKSGDYSARAVVIPVLTRKVNPNATEVNYGRLGPDKDHYINLMKVKTPDGTRHKPDAAFWSESSVEKFVVPYYASKHGHEAGKAVREVLKVLHRLDDAGKETAGRAPDDPFALVHVPTSEYIPGSVADAGTALIHGEFFAARIDPDDKRGASWISLAKLVELQEAAGTPAPAPEEPRG